MCVACPPTNPWVAGPWRELSPLMFCAGLKPGPVTAVGIRLLEQTTEGCLQAYEI